jgi:hypothetical protein
MPVNQLINYAGRQLVNRNAPSNSKMDANGTRNTMANDNGGLSLYLVPLLPVEA